MHQSAVKVKLLCVFKVTHTGHSVKHNLQRYSEIQFTTLDKPLDNFIHYMSDSSRYLMKGSSCSVSFTVHLRPLSLLTVTLISSNTDENELFNTKEVTV